MKTVNPLIRRLAPVGPKLLLCIALLVAVGFGSLTVAQAAPRAGTISVVVVNRLILWRSPSLRSPIVAILLRGRLFSADGRTLSGSWIHGVTDRGTPGWLPSRGFLMLHPEVSLAMLPVMTAMNSSMNRAPPAPMPRSMPIGY